MAFQLFATGISQSLGRATFNGSWSGAVLGCSGNPPNVRFAWGYTGFHNLTPEHNGNASAGSWSSSVDVDKDKAIKYRAIGVDCDTDKQSTNVNAKTYADGANFPSGLTPGAKTTTTCDVSGSVVPNTNESTGSVTIQFRVQGTAPWNEIGPIASGLSGNGPIALGGTIEGLSPNTTYEARYKITRNTANDQAAFSNIGVFTTVSAGVPTVIGVPSMEIPVQFLLPTSLSGTRIQLTEAMEIPVQMFLPILREGIEGIFSLDNVVISDEIVLIMEFD